MSGNKVFCTIIFFLVSFYSFAQVELKARIVGQDAKKPKQCNIILRSVTNSPRFTFSNRDGIFSFPKTSAGNYTLEINSLGFAKETREVTVTSTRSNLDSVIVLRTDYTKLNEVIITSKIPVRLNGDTIVIDASAFTNGNERVVEDILKKIPGLTIDAQGKIMIGNKEVQKVMVEGDDFFGKGYSLLTKNMPANPIAKIEILQKYSENKLLKGFENSEKLALNLTLKDNYKRTWFGNVSAASSAQSNTKFEVIQNAMNFGKKNKYYFLGNANNIGNEPQGNFESYSGLTADFESSKIGEGIAAAKIVNIGTELPPLNRNRALLNNSQLGGLNSIFNLNKNLKLKLVTLVTNDNLARNRNALTSYESAGLIFDIKENENNQTHSSAGFGSLQLDYNINKNSAVLFESKNRNAKSFGNTLYALNDTSNSFSLNEKTSLGGHRLQYTTKLTNTKVLVLQAAFKRNTLYQSLSSSDFPYVSLFMDSGTQFQQPITFSLSYCGIKGEYFNKFKKERLLSISFGYNDRTEKLNTAFNYLTNTGIYKSPTSYQNSIDKYKQKEYYANSMFSMKFKNLSLKTGLSASVYNNQFVADSSYAKKLLFLSPSITITQRLSKRNSISASYSFNNKTSSTIQNLLPNFINSGLRQFEKGNSQIFFPSSNILVLNYGYGNFGDNFLATSFLSYIKSNTFIGSNLVIAPDYLLSFAEAFPENESLLTNTQINWYFKPLKTNIKLILNGSISSYQNRINGSGIRRLTTRLVSPEVQWRTILTDNFNFNAGTKVDVVKVIGGSNSSIITSNSFADFSYSYTKKINSSLKIERYVINKNTRYSFINFETSYEVKENKLKFSLSGDNLLNTKFFTSRNITDFTSSLLSYRIQPRFVMLRCEYRF